MNFQKVAFFMLVLFLRNVDAKVYNLDGRIVGGEDASINSFPYQVSLRRYSSHICGGSIFHDNYVLTAAHCVAGVPIAAAYSLRVGSTDVNTGGSLYNVKSIYVHEKYNNATMNNDIAILKLSSVLQFSKSVLPISLAEQGEILEVGVSAIITGWGYKEETGKQISSVLQQVQVPIISRSRCQQSYAPNEEITENMICAGVLTQGGKDACQGDSGGPMRANGKLFGVTSWGYGCARPMHPGVYTNVGSFRNWIRQKTNY